MLNDNIDIDIESWIKIVRMQEYGSSLFERRLLMMNNENNFKSCRRRSLPLSGLSVTKLADHYSSCIKLSAENVSLFVYNCQSVYTFWKPLWIDNGRKFYFNTIV